MQEVNVGIIGSGFVAEIHARSLQQVPGTNLAAVASRNETHAAAFASRFQIPQCFTDYRRVLELADVDVVSLCLPNNLHCEAAVAAAEAGKHVICEKPLCMNLPEADRMIEACKRSGVHLLYAEELIFAPKYVRARQLVQEGALGKVYLVKQAERHFGPHSEWFWDVEKSGGGALQDMGCHGVEFARWMLGRPAAVAVTAHCGTYVHAGKTKADDTAVAMIEFEGGALGVIEPSWATPGGMDDRSEIYGDQGVTFADLLRGSSLVTYSEPGYGYAVEKAATTRGWTFTMFEESWNYGFPQEMAHFIACVRGDAEPLATGEDGRAVLEILFAAYESAATGRRVSLPVSTEAPYPIYPWLHRRNTE
jgi:predicted dehydrogenase